MLFKFYKVSFFILLIFFQNQSYSKNQEENKFDSKSFTNYLSATISYKNHENAKALKFFKVSKNLVNKHQPFLSKYIDSLITYGDVDQAIKELKKSSNKKNIDFFESYLLLTVDSLNKKNYKNSYKFLNKLEKFKSKGTIELVIYETLKSYIYLYKNKKFAEQKTQFGNLSLITRAFQSCYLSDHEKIKVNFDNLINNDSIDSSRYIFFYINYLINNDNVIEAKKISNKTNILNSSLLVLQSKNWIDKNMLSKFKDSFSCKNEQDILSEFFFLIGNLYSSEKNIEKSNFYLNISNNLNPKFKLNLSLLAENYYSLKNYKEVSKILRSFNKNDDLYYWFKIKKKTQIISIKENDDEALNFLFSRLKKIDSLSIKILYDTANIAKKFEKFEISIDYYNKILSKVEYNSLLYSDIVYRRGGSLERIGEHVKSDKDLLKALEINPNNAYILNYLAYAWLERSYRTEDAMKMLKKAYQIKKDDPFILDSVGWAYYLINNFNKAEEFLRRAIELMPNDPILRDHYGDILWKLDRKLQAKYFWKSVLSLKDVDKETIENINIKLLKGLQKDLI